MIDEGRINYFGDPLGNYNGHRICASYRISCTSDSSLLSVLATYQSLTLSIRCNLPSSLNVRILRMLPCM